MEFASLWYCHYRSSDADSTESRRGNDSVRTTGSHLVQEWRNEVRLVSGKQTPVTEFCFYEMSVKTLTPQGDGNQANETAKTKKRPELKLYLPVCSGGITPEIYFQITTLAQGLHF